MTVVGAGDINRAMETRELSTELTDQDRVLLVFGYLGPLALFSLVASRKEFVKWHAKQGILLSAAAVLLYLALKAVHLVLERVLWPLLGQLFWLAAGMVGVGVALLLVLCIVRALEGERFRVPMLGDLADQF